METQLRAPDIHVSPPAFSKLLMDTDLAQSNFFVAKYAQSLCVKLTKLIEKPLPSTDDVIDQVLSPMGAELSVIAPALIK